MCVLILVLLLLLNMVWVAAWLGNQMHERLSVHQWLLVVMLLVMMLLAETRYGMSPLQAWIEDSLWWLVLHLLMLWLVVGHWCLLVDYGHLIDLHGTVEATALPCMVAVGGLLD